MKIVGSVLAAAALFCASTAVAAARPTAPTKAAPLKAASKPKPAKAYVVKRTAFGHPSFEGMWGANFLLTFETQKDAPTLTLPEPEAKVLAAARAKKVAANFEKGLDPETPAQMQTIDGLPIVRGERRTRLVTLPADGRLPYTPAARQELKDGSPDKYDNPEDRPNAERCLVGGGQPPLTSFTFSDLLQIVQTRDAVVIHTEYGGDMRVAPFAEKHGPAIFEDKLGDSIARWEGDTLVVETIRMPDADRDHFYPVLIVPGDSTVVERFTRVSAKELLYQFTVIDPKVFTAPWSGEFSFYATDKLMYEHACHEGNYALSGILAGARHDEKIAEAAPHTPKK